MSTKEWLSRAWEIDKEIKALEAEKEAAKTLAFSVTVRYSGEKVQTSCENSTENAMVKYIDYCTKINNRIDDLYAVKCEILDAISKVDNSTYRTLLALRYLRFLTWERIAEEMGFSDVRWVYELHKRALKAVSGVIPRSNML